MSAVILHILSIVGTILLILLILLLAVLLIVLFYPITYRICGKKTSEEMSLDARINWLFGLLRIRYAYPEPGNITVKLLWKTVFDSSRKKEDSSADAASSHEETAHTTEQQSALPGNETKGKMLEDGRNADQDKNAETAQAKPEETADQTAPDEPESGILGKFTKIRYTIQKIYDKIKEIWENISYYSQLLQEENTAKLWQHVKLRLGKIWKSIRPRHIRAEILFGTGSPDTTGYAFGIYSMLSPLLGPRVCVTPDFNQAILQGNADISGHITAFLLLWNALRLLLDKKLRLFLKKIKRNSKAKKQTAG